jgi:hypothetical protein
METDVVHTVLNEVLEDLKELKHQQVSLTTIISDLNNKVDDFELKLSDIKVTSPPTNLEPITSAIDLGISRLGGIIEEQPKSITRQIKFQFFPEYGATEYYKIVFGRLFFWMMIFLVATYLFSLSRQFIDGYNIAKYKEAESIQFRKAWINLYDNSKKGLRMKMDSVLMKSSRKKPR